MLRPTLVAMSRRALPALLALSVLATATACEREGRGSTARRWLENPESGAVDGAFIRVPGIDVEFEIPDTLYVFKNCGELPHQPDEGSKWIPVLECRSVDLDSDSGDEFAAENEGRESIALTFYAAKKTRPIDERSVAWFTNLYRQEGLEVDDIWFNGDYQRKPGIFAKLQVLEEDGGRPERVIEQFMFPKDDVVIIARMEYPFGETRSVSQDWNYILWNFNHRPEAK